MATLQMEELGIPAGQVRLDLVGLVKVDTWKDLLVELVRKNKLDPWNVDIEEIVDSYVEAVKALKVMDLRIPANIILAAALLLRLKSEMLGFEENGEPVDEGPPFVRPDVQVGGLALRLRPPLKKRITLDELIVALDEAMKLKERRESDSRPENIHIPIAIKGIDIERAVESMYAEIKRHVDRERMTTFSYLVSKADVDDVILELFIPLLFLAHKNRILLMQERFFEEIIIALPRKQV